MTNNTQNNEIKKAILQKPQILQNTINQLKLMTEEYRNLSVAEPSIPTTDNSWEEKARLEEERLKKIETDLEKYKKIIIAAIDRIPEYDLRLVLFYHYVENYSWAQIQKKMYASRSTILRMHRRALTLLKF